MPSHDHFEWDSGKERTNIRKHGVALSDAARVLADPFARIFHITWQDDRNEYGEDRWITLGSDPYDRQIVLYIVWTHREDKRGPVTRIISARTTTRLEQRAYEANTYPL